MKQKAQKQEPETQAAQPTPKMLPIAVLTITYAPPEQRVISVLPNFPLQMSAEDALAILRAAEHKIIAEMTMAQAKAQQEKPA